MSIDVCRCPGCGADVAVYERAARARIVAWLRGEAATDRKAAERLRPELRAELDISAKVLAATAELLEDGADRS